MDPLTTAAVISGGASLLGGGMSMFGASAANANARDVAERNIALQREFAQNGIRWRVADAKAAGIHPVYALGANTTSFSPISVGEVQDSMPQAIANMGQDIGRAVSAGKTDSEKTLSALQISMAKADLDGKLLDNQLRSKRLADTLVSRPSIPGPDAANFIPGQPNSNSLVSVKPAERTASQPGRLAQEAGWRPDVSFARTDSGLVPMVPESLSESLEDDIIGKLMWRWRNQAVPNITGRGAPSKSQLPKGASSWYWSHRGQEWRPSYDGSAVETFGPFNK